MPTPLFRAPSLLAGLTAAAALAVISTAHAGTYAYLDDANVQGDAPVISGDFPKVMLTETQSLDGTAEQFSKYDVIGTKAGMLWKIEQIQDVDPSVNHHYGFDLRGYQGWILSDPCDYGMGLTFSRTGPATENCQVYSGHWLYYAGTRLARSVDATSNTLFVNDASRINVGQYIVIYDAPAGSFNNAEHARVVAVDRNSTPNKVTVAARGFKSTGRWHAQGAIVAQHAIGRGRNDPRNWAYNLVLNGPRDSRGRTMGQALVNWMALNINKKSSGAPTDATVNGIYFDADPYFNLVDRGLDGNNDLVVDDLFSPAGVNLWGDGLEQVYGLFRQRFPGKTIVGGNRNSRGFDALNGVQMEGWATAGDFDAEEPNYGHTGGYDGFDALFQRYMVHLQYHQTGTGYAENLRKSPTKLYNHGVWGVDTNAPFRFGLATTLMGNGHYGEQNSAEDPDPWWDEYAVDVDPDSPNYGKAIASTPWNEAAVRSHKGWLGRPLGPHERVYDDATFAPWRSEIPNGGFENGDSGWSYVNVNKYVDSAVSLAGSRSLKLTGLKNFTTVAGGATAKAPAVYLQAGKEYTLAFSVRATKMRRILVRVQGPLNPYLVPPRWTRIVHTFKATQSGNYRPEFMVGLEDIPMWIDEVYLFEGNANVFMRDFENGRVIANATPSGVSVQLEEPFLRIKGTGQDPVNNGAQVTSVWLPPYDAAILVRTKTSTAPPPAPPPAPAPTPTPPPPSDEIVCGQPVEIQDGVRRVYAWNWCNSDRWVVEVSQSSTTEGRYAGVISAAWGTLSALNLQELESHDSVSIVNGGSEIDFLMRVWNGTDRFAFSAPPSGTLCLSLDSPVNAQVFVGKNAVPVGTSVDLRTGASCSP